MRRVEQSVIRLSLTQIPYMKHGWQALRPDLSSVQPKQARQRWLTCTWMRWELLWLQFFMHRTLQKQDSNTQKWKKKRFALSSSNVPLDERLWGDVKTFIHLQGDDELLQGNYYWFANWVFSPDKNLSLAKNKIENLHTPKTEMFRNATEYCFSAVRKCKNSFCTLMQVIKRVRFQCLLSQL